MTTGRSFTLDDTEVSFEPGQTLLTAALAVGAYIPHLCAHPDFSPHGSCRVCLVEIDGYDRPACTTLATPGLTVRSDTRTLNTLRRQLIQLLFVEGNHFCPSCEQSGQCQLQATAYHLDMIDLHFPPLSPSRELDASHAELLLDRDRCIGCELCVQASSQVDQKHIFSLGGRGTNTRLVVNSEHNQLGETNMAVTDRAAHVCPVGAILFKQGNYAQTFGQRLYDQQSIAKIGNLRPEEVDPGELHSEQLDSAALDTPPTPSVDQAND